LRKSGILDKSLVKRILIARPNHRLGNMLLVTPLLQELQLDFPNAKIDVFAKGKLVDILFENYDNFNTSIQLSRKPAKDILGYLNAWIRVLTTKYDLVINVDAGSKSGGIASKYSRSRYRVIGQKERLSIQKFSDHVHLAKYPVYAYWSAFGIEKRSIAPLRLKLSEKEKSNGFKIYQALQDQGKPIIFLFTYATNNKIYDSSWWRPFYEALDKDFGSTHTIVEVLPVENISQFNHELKHYYSKDVREIAAVLANAALFIGADSGMMHLAVASGVDTLGLFKVTKPEKYEPYGGKSGYIDTNKSTFSEMMAQVATVLNR
jgi:ADP-heptose:LPS heptosyltransferase